MSTPTLHRTERGIMYTAAAYLLWGFLPLYFLLLAPTGPWEIVALRVLFSLVFCVLLLTVTRGWRALWSIVRQPRLLGLTALAGLLIYINWQVFLLGTLGGHIVETSLGYFINPITMVLLGVFVLHERLRSLQWVAVAVTAVAVIVIIVGYGSFPWIALSLTLSFGVYGMLKRRIGPTVDAITGLSLESLWLAPLAVVQLIFVGATTGITMPGYGFWHAVLLCLLGVVTAVPLLLFAAGARRITLSAIGILQLIAPILQFIIGVAVMNEPMPAERWVGFVLVWVAIAVFLFDLLTRRSSDAVLNR